MHPAVQRAEVFRIDRPWALTQAQPVTKDLSTADALYIDKAAELVEVQEAPLELHVLSPGFNGSFTFRGGVPNP